MEANFVEITHQVSGLMTKWPPRAKQRILVRFRTARNFAFDFLLIVPTSVPLVKNDCVPWVPDRLSHVGILSGDFFLTLLNFEADHPRVGSDGWILVFCEETWESDPKRAWLVLIHSVFIQKGLSPKKLCPPQEGFIGIWDASVQKKRIRMDCLGEYEKKTATEKILENYRTSYTLGLSSLSSPSLPFISSWSIGSGHSVHPWEHE